VQEHHYTPAQLARGIDDLGLQFLGFINLPNRIKEEYAIAYPHDERRLDLKFWDQIEEQNPDIFAGMFQFYCQLEGNPVTHLDHKHS